MKPEIHSKKFKKRGFTTIEVAVSVFVLSIAVIGGYNAFSLMAVLTSNTSDRFIGAYLAQEGVEIVRNIRDQNWIDEDDWETDLDNCANGCEVDYKTGTSITDIIVPWAGEGTYLKANAGFYNYALGTDTKFKRKIIITVVSDPSVLDGVMHVLVEVTWKKIKNVVEPTTEQAGQCLQSNCIIAEEYLYNWY